MKMKYSKHADKRINQRGISKRVIDYILSYGSCIHTHGDSKFYLKKETLKFLCSEDSIFIKQNEKQLLSTAVVCDQNTVITVMKRFKKIRK